MKEITIGGGTTDMKRTLVIADIHGCYKEFLALLEKAAYQPEKDRLIILGDMIDRGKQSLEVVEHIMALKQTHDVIVIGGNHEELFCNWYEESFNREHIYVKNGGWKTIHSYCKPFGVYGKVPATKLVFQRHYSEHVAFFKNLPDYFEDEAAIYVHAGIDLTLQDWHLTPKETFRWIREDFWNKANNTGKIIVFGHTPTCFLHEESGIKSFAIWQSEDGKVGIDGGCSMGGKLHALCLEDTGLSVFSVDKIK